MTIMMGVAYEYCYCLQLEGSSYNHEIIMRLKTEGQLQLEDSCNWKGFYNWRDCYNRKNGSGGAVKNGRVVLEERLQLEGAVLEKQGFRLSWPPSCCRYQPIAFMGSEGRRFGHLNLTFGSSHIASSTYQRWPTRNPGIPHQITGEGVSGGAGVS